MLDRRRFAAPLALLLVAGCPAKKDRPADPAPPAGSAAVVAATLEVEPRVLATGQVALPPPPPVPLPPAGLPPLPADKAPTGAEIALGELLFFEPRLAVDATTACATCHEPARGFAGGVPRSANADGKPNLRHTPTLYNLAWHGELGWDGRSIDRTSFLASHVASQLGLPLETGLVRLLGSPTYAAHFARTAGGRAADATASAALLAYVATLYSGDAPWDAHERGDDDGLLAGAELGYALFNGKAQCATCHAPPLYTDLGYHRLGLIASPDDGRGRVDPAAAGAFKTPTLRGVAARAPLFHDGSAATLEAAIDWHLAGGRGQQADPSVIDPALPVVTLTADERAALIAFVRALTPRAAPPAPALLPTDLPQVRSSR